MNESTLYYYQSDEPVLPGDKILINKLLKSNSFATVTYIPGISKYDKENGNDQWSYKIEGGDYYVMGYDPCNKHFASKRIKLITRANSEEFEEIKSSVAPNEIGSTTSILGEMTWLLLLSLAIFVVIFIFKVLL